MPIVDSISASVFNDMIVYLRAVSGQMGWQPQNFFCIFLRDQAVSLPVAETDCYTQVYTKRNNFYSSRHDGPLDKTNIQFTGLIDLVGLLSQLLNPFEYFCIVLYLFTNERFYA